MRRDAVKILVAIVLAAQSSPLWSADGDGGQLGATLRIGQGPRALAMGSAFTAIADDASAVFYNPAGLAQLRTTHMEFSWRVMRLLDRKQGYFDAAFPLREDATLALAWVHSGVGGIVERDLSGAAGDEFGFSENLISATFARVFGRILAVGGSLHFVHQSFFDISASTVGLSAGLHARFDRSSRSPFPAYMQRLTLAAAVQHAGMTMRFNSDDYYVPRGGTGGTVTEDFPIVGRLGAAYRFLGDRSLLVSAEGTYVQDQHVRGYFGAEWTADPRLLLRAGVADLDPTFGIGLRQPWGKSVITINYAFLTSPVGADADHVFALGIGF